jgi:hypothetical protein
MLGLDRSELVEELIVEHLQEFMVNCRRRLRNHNAPQTRIGSE